MHTLYSRTGPPEPALFNPSVDCTEPPAKPPPTCSVPCSRNRAIGLGRSPVPAYNDPVKHPLMSAGRRRETLTKTPTSALRERDERRRSLNFFSVSSINLFSLLSSLQLTVSWQNVEGKFHGWWRRCENVTLWAINKEVWL